MQSEYNTSQTTQCAVCHMTEERVSHLRRQLAQLQESSARRETQLLRQVKVLLEQNNNLVGLLKKISEVASPSAEYPDGHIDLHEYNDTQSQVSGQNIPSTELSQSQDACTGQSDGRVRELNAQHRSRTRLPSIAKVVTPGSPDITAVESIETDALRRVPSGGQASYLDISRQLSADESAFDERYPQATVSTRQGYQDFQENSLIQQNAAPRYAPNSSSHLSHVDADQVFTVLPVHVPATCPLDGILLGFFDSRRDMLSEGASADDVVGPEKASVQALFHTELSVQVHPVSRVMSEVLSTYPMVGKAEQMALLYLMHQTMRWQIIPTRESYLFMPTWLRPTATQITVPHAAWIDNVPWPCVRDMLIEYPDDYPYQLWTENFTHNASVNWRFEIQDALTAAGDDVVLHSIFEKHIRDLKNWTVSEKFQTLFPDLMRAIRFYD